MNASRCLSKICPWLLAAALLPGVFTVSSHAATNKKKNPTSKLYVAEIDGSSEIDTGEKIEELTEKSVFSAEGTVIETKADTTNAIVLSNGTGIFFDPETRLDIRRFLQEPFSPSRNDLEVEPSVSQTQTYLARGTVGLCTSKLVAGSSMVYNTDLANISIRGRKVVIESTDNETKVSLLEGDVTIQGETFTGGEVLQPGQQAIIRRASPSSPPEIIIQAIPEDEKAALEDRVTMACMARRTVYFDVADRETNDLNGDDYNPFAGPGDGPGDGPDEDFAPLNPRDNGPIVTPNSIQ